MRYDYYETKQTMVVVIYTKDEIKVELNNKNLKIIITDEEKLINLYDFVDSYSVTDYPHKHEIILKKIKEENWGCLEQKKEFKPKEYNIQVSDDEDKDSIMNFLQKVYANADDDTKRAMNKSFIESKGKVLNTKWDDVSKNKYDSK